METIEIEFRTDDETLREACRRYWQIDEKGRFISSLVEVAAAAGLSKGKVASVVASNCTAFTRARSCSGCGQPRPFRSRADYQYRRRDTWSSWTCDTCRQSAQDAAELEAKRKKQEAFDLVQAALDRSVDQDTLHLEEISLRNAVFLVALIRAAGSEDRGFIAPYDTLPTNTLLTPTPELDLEVLNTLHDQGVVCVHPGSRERTVVIEGRRFKSFFPLKVHWILPLSKDGPSPARFVEDLESEVQSKERWDDGWRDEVPELRRLVALHECLQYLRVVLDDHGFDFEAGEKTRTVLKEVLTRFSVAQAYNFIWRAARDAAAFLVRHSATRRHAANTVPGAIQRMAERSIAERWEVKSYRRDFRAPQSILSQVLFVTALQLPDGGFSSVVPVAPDGGSPHEAPPDMSNVTSPPADKAGNAETEFLEQSTREHLAEAERQRLEEERHRLEGRRPCPSCGGRGEAQQQDGSFLDCGTCDGTGLMDRPE